MRLGEMVIFVPDLQEAKRFYCDILGFPLQNESSSRLAFVHEGCNFAAFKCDRSSPVEDYSRVARSVFAFEVASIEATMQDLRQKGVEFLHEEPAGNDFSRYAAFLDPFGNVHEIYEPKTPVHQCR